MREYDFTKSASDLKLRGEVKHWNASRGFGFLRRDDGEKDCFVHISELEKAGLDGLQEGQRVAFDVRQESKGLRAIAIELSQ